MKLIKFALNKNAIKNTKVLQIKEKYEMQKKHITDENNSLIVINSKGLLNKLVLESRNLMLETNNFIQKCTPQNCRDNTLMLQNIIEEIDSSLTFFPHRRRYSSERLHYICKNI